VRRLIFTIGRSRSLSDDVHHRCAVFVLSSPRVVGSPRGDACPARLSKAAERDGPNEGKDSSGGAVELGKPSETQRRRQPSCPAGGLSVRAGGSVSAAVRCRAVGTSYFTKAFTRCRPQPRTRRQRNQFHVYLPLTNCSTTTRVLRINYSVLAAAAAATTINRLLGILGRKNHICICYLAWHWKIGVRV